MPSIGRIPPKAAWRLLFAVAFLAFAFFTIKRIVFNEPVSDLYQVTFDLDPSGQEIVFSSSGNQSSGTDLYLLNLRNNKVRRLTNSPRIEENPAFSPNGRDIVYSARNDGRNEHLFIVSKSTGMTRQITQGNYSDTSPSFSSDGANIIFSRSHRFRLGAMAQPGWVDQDIYSIKIKDSELRRLTWSKSVKLQDVHYSLDKKHIVFAVPRSHLDEHVSLVKIGDTANQPLFHRKLSANPALFDNHQILITRYETPYSNSRAFLSLIKFDGSLIRDLMTVPVGIRNLVVTADQRYVYFIAPGEENNPALWKADVKQQSFQKIVDNKLFDTPLAWVP